MSKPTNELRVDLAGNPGVAAYFSGMKAGDKGEVTIKFTVKEIDPANDAVLGIDKVITEDQEETTEVTPDAEEPMAMEISQTQPDGEEPIETTLGKALKTATKGAMKEEVAGAY